MKKASDIVKESLQLANLGNTTFATHKELENYINDGFFSIYNDLIDKGNEYWLKEAFAQRNNTSANAYWLPRDFYRAKSVKSCGSLVPRASRSATGYSIRNGQLFMDNYSGAVKLEYYPKPTYISFPTSTIDTELQDNIVATYKDWYLTIDCKIHNINTKEEIDTGLSEELNTTDFLRLGEGMIYGVNFQGQRCIWNWQGSLIINLGDELIFFGTDGNIYGLSENEPEDEYYYIYNVALDIYTGVRIAKTAINKNDIYLYQNSDSSINGFLCADENKHFYFVDIDGNKYECPETSSVLFDYTPTFDQLTDWDDNAYYVVNKYSNVVEIYTINTETGYLDRLEYKVPGTVNYGLIEFDDNFYFITGTLLKTQLVGYEPDTLMDYPNNAFYRALAAYIAIQLLAKQGADTTNMQASFSSLVSTFNQSKDSSADYPVIASYY